jgi:hypothetical protein
MESLINMKMPTGLRSTPLNQRCGVYVKILTDGRRIALNEVLYDDIGNFNNGDLDSTLSAFDVAVDKEFDLINQLKAQGYEVTWKATIISFCATDQNKYQCHIISEQQHKRANRRRGYERIFILIRCHQGIGSAWL